ncbi:MAG TPA: mechanosensitive ion channel domain-containing protein [Methylophilaceae bacterium]|nr:mechanosensitive ion channel domain-containing protein [Methylophilaceae bacterium]
MLEHLLPVTTWLEDRVVLQMLIYGLGLVGLAWFVNTFIKVLLLKLAFGLLQAMPLEHRGSGRKLIRRLANILPAFVISVCIALIPDIHPVFVAVVQNVANAFIVLVIALAISDALDVANSFYQMRKDAHLHPIKGYLQIAKILVFALASILIVATLIDRSPLILLSGIGAMAAVLMLIFQDTLLSLVASIQISSNDMVRVGDWIEMPQLNADGDVIDVALHTVKVQNWDKTITTIPTKRLISESFKNWRGMQESGGRRIKRSLHLDQNSIGFLDAESLQRMRTFDVLQDYLESKLTEIDGWNRRVTDKGLAPVNSRRITNIGIFRAYIEQYLRHHPRIQQDMTLLVRQLAPGEHGLPIEIYCFTNTVNWNAYEAIQSDIFDHLLAILPQFGLRVFQNPTGMDLTALAHSRMRA